MKNFQKRIDEIEVQFTNTDEKIRTELKATEQALATAQERVRTLETKYKVELAKGGQDAVRLKVEVEVAKDSVALLEEMVGQLEAELNAGEIVEAQMRRHEAICAAVEAEGAHAIHEALVVAQEARDAYRAALETLVQVQHSVADVGRRSYTRTAKLGRPLDTPQVARYTASDFEIPAPVESASAVSFL